MSVSQPFDQDLKHEQCALLIELGIGICFVGLKGVMSWKPRIQELIVQQRLATGIVWETAGHWHQFLFLC